MKTCATCKCNLEPSCFHRKADAKDGLHPSCKSCRKCLSAQYRVDNADRLRAFDIARYRRPDRYAAKIKQNAAAYVENKPRLLSQMAAYAKVNPEIVMKAKNAYKARNPAKILAATRKRQARKLNAMPAWANQFFIEEAYDLARLRTKMFGFKWHVDHTVPLLSKQVCGLHCEANLQVIPASVNAAKGNRTWPDMFV